MKVEIITRLVRTSDIIASMTERGSPRRIKEQPAEQSKRTVGILIFEDVEVLDFAGPFEVFSAARAVGQHNEERQLFNVLTVAERADQVRATGGLLIQPHFTIDDHSPLDILVVPGGWGTRRERKNQRLLDWIAAQNQKTEITASVCTGALLLAESGLLNGQRVTTHWNSLEWMQQTYPAITMVEGKRFIDGGHVITSAGISAGIDMSLYLVAKIHGIAIARQTARRMEYKWKRD